MRMRIGAGSALLFCWALWGIGLPAEAGGAVVRGVLFYSPTCPHCHEVMTRDLPPLLEQYGDRLQLATINVRTEAGRALYQAGIERFDIGTDRQGVPTLLIGDRVLVGGDEIPRLLPPLVEALLAAGGNDWPDIEGLGAALLGAVDEESAQPPAEGWAGVRARFAQDPRGNGLAVATLVVMTLVSARVLTGLTRSAATPLGRKPGLGLALLGAVGLAVAGYLAFVEAAGVAAVCGPVGDCNTVQQSEYARLFGVIPLGVLGVLAYLDVLAGWLLARFGRARVAALGWAFMFLVALAGTLFSFYLTFLEPFVIGATCIWCLISAAIMTALLWLTRDSGAAALARGLGPAGKSNADVPG